MQVLRWGFAGFIGFNVYKDSKLEEELAVSDSYQTLIEASVNDKATFAQNAEKFINENAGTSYESLTALALAKEFATDKDWKNAQAPVDGSN